MVSTVVSENFTLSNFVWGEVKKALNQAGFNINPWVTYRVSNVRETPEGFIRYTLHTSAASAGFSGHQNSVAHEFEVLQSIAAPMAVRVTVKGNHISIKHY